jgi:hypothetical protein
MTRFALLKDALGTLRRHGLDAEVEHGSHFKIRFINTLGSNCLLVVSRTPGNRSAIKASRAELRRLLRRPAR